MVLIGRNHVQKQGSQGFEGGIVADVQHIADPQGAPCVAAELAQRESGAAAQVQRYIQPAAQRQVRAGAGSLHRTHLQYAARFYRMRLPQRQRRAVHADSHGRAADGDHAVVVKAQAGAAKRAFQRGGMVRIAHQPIRQAHGQVVHGP